jgi:hypothetical protein
VPLRIAKRVWVWVFGRKGVEGERWERGGVGGGNSAGRRRCIQEHVILVKGRRQEPRYSLGVTELGRTRPFPPD